MGEAQQTPKSAGTRKPSAAGAACAGMAEHAHHGSRRYAVDTRRKSTVPKSLLAEELDLDLDLPTGLRRAVQSASAPATEVVAIYARMADSLEKSCQKSENVARTRFRGNNSASAHTARAPVVSGARERCAGGGRADEQAGAHRPRACSDDGHLPKSGATTDKPQRRRPARTVKSTASLGIKCTPWGCATQGTCSDGK